jgi:hypothetical protein
MDPNSDSSVEERTMSDNASELQFEDDPELLRIAKALSDGQPVDWGVGADLSVEEDSEKLRLLRRLRVLQEVAAAHRQVLEGTGESSDPQHGG